MNAYRRRLVSAAGETVAVTVTAPVQLRHVAATWTAGAGTISVAVDSVTVATASGTAAAVVRLDRPELVHTGATITVTMPAAGSVELRGTTGARC